MQGLSDPAGGKRWRTDRCAIVGMTGIITIIAIERQVSYQAIVQCAGIDIQQGAGTIGGACSIANDHIVRTLITGQNTGNRVSRICRTSYGSRAFIPLIGQVGAASCYDCEGYRCARRNEFGNRLRSDRRRQNTGEGDGSQLAGD